MCVRVCLFVCLASYDWCVSSLFVVQLCVHLSMLLTCGLLFSLQLQALGLPVFMKVHMCVRESTCVCS